MLLRFVELALLAVFELAKRSSFVGVVLRLGLAVRFGDLVRFERTIGSEVSVSLEGGFLLNLLSATSIGGARLGGFRLTASNEEKEEDKRAISPGGGVLIRRGNCCRIPDAFFFGGAPSGATLVSLLNDFCWSLVVEEDRLRDCRLVEECLNVSGWSLSKVVETIDFDVLIEFCLMASKVEKEEES